MVVRKTIKTIWDEGYKRVGVAERYVKEAIKGKEDLILSVGADEMIIENFEIKAKIIGRSAWLEDKFGRGKYRLVYFAWRPMSEDDKLKRFSEQVL